MSRCSIRANRKVKTENADKQPVKKNANKKAPAKKVKKTTKKATTKDK